MDEIVLDFEEIRRLLPQSYPLLMIDRVTELEPGRRLAGTKCVTGNESFFQGHFPGMAVMPAALVLEALAQATILLVRRSAQLRGGAEAEGEAAGWVWLFGSVHAKMHRPVVPGDLLRLETSLTKVMEGSGAAQGLASVDGQRAVEAEMYFFRVQASELRKRLR